MASENGFEAEHNPYEAGYAGKQKHRLFETPKFKGSEHIKSYPKSGSDESKQRTSPVLIITNDSSIALASRTGDQPTCVRNGFES